MIQLFVSHILGMSSSQLTNFIIDFSEGLAAPTNQPIKTMKSQFYTIFLWTAGGHHGLGIISPFISPFVCFFVAGKIHNISLGFTCLDQPRLSSKGQADPGLGFSMSSLRYSKCSPDFPMTVSGYKPSFLEDVQ
jgi:hypothetical protein